MRIALFSVQGGKFHAPRCEINQKDVWRPTESACGLRVTPLNYFQSAGDADRYTGGRLKTLLCQRCFGDAQ